MRYARIKAALALRNRLFAEPFYRLVHAEADGLPGMVIDRFGDMLVCQLNSAGMAGLEEPLIETCEALLKPQAIVLRNDSPARSLEGLETETRVVRGSIDGPIATAWDYVRSQARTIHDFQGDGECATRTVLK